MGEDYPMQEAAKCGVATRPTLTIELTRKKERLEAELAKVNEVLAVVKKNPEVQQVFDAVSTIRGIL